jgi:hypothetical protein
MRRFVHNPSPIFHQQVVKAEPPFSQDIAGDVGIAEPEPHRASYSTFTKMVQLRAT